VGPVTRASESAGAARLRGAAATAGADASSARAAGLGVDGVLQQPFGMACAMAALPTQQACCRGSTLGAQQAARPADSAGEAAARIAATAKTRRTVGKAITSRR